jgi:mannose-1-phosphate guanylyltransferase
MAPRAMVLAAGLGTRLRPLTLELPKPLVPVGDRSLLGHIVARLAAAGHRELVINTHHLPEAFINVDQDLGVVFHRVHEPVIRGTAGGVTGARELFGPAPILLWNGDILVDPPLAALEDAAGDGGLVLGIAPRPAGDGTVGVARDGRVVRLRGERFGPEDRGGDYVGVAALGARCLAALPEEGCLVGDYALPELRAGRSVRTVDVPGGFSDAGDPRAYLELNLAWLRERPGGVHVGAGARVAPDVRLVTSIVGAGARVDGSGELRRVVVWPGARASAPLADAVVTRSGRVVSVSDMHEAR